MVQFEPRSPTTGLLAGRHIRSADQTAALTLTTSFVDVPGCALQLPLTGRYLVFGEFLMHRNFDLLTNDDNVRLQGRLSHDLDEPQLVESVDQGLVARTHAGVWVIDARRDNVLVKLQARKATDPLSGSSRIGNASSPFGSTLVALYF